MIKLNCSAAFFVLSLLAVTSPVQALELVGLVEPHMVVKIGSPALGIVESISVDRGDQIKKGQQVAQLDSRIETVEADLAKERSTFLSGKHDRLKSLGTNSMASIEEIDQARSEMRVANYEIARRNILLQNRRIESPVNGVVVQRLLSPGEYAYEQTPVMVVAQIDPLNIEVLAPTSYYSKIVKGMKATVTLETGTDKPQTAKVIVIDKVMDAASNTFGVRLELANPNFDIPAGQKCKVIFSDL